MWFLLAGLLAAQQPALQKPFADTTRAAGAFADAGARDLLVRASARRAAQDRSIREYRATVKERISLGIQALRRDRLLYRRELAAHIEWRRDALSRIDIIGAREALPAVLSGLQMPSDIDASTYLAFEPADDRLFVGMDSSFVEHPLAARSHADYRYASGDTTRLRLPDGRTISIIELRVTPVRKDVHLVAGALWVDASTYDVVRAVFRLADSFDLARDGDPGDIDDVPGVLRPIRADIHFLTVEYGLVQLHWWMPRTIAVEGTADVGTLMHFPLRYERTYSDYDVAGDTASAASSSAHAPLPADTILRKSCTKQMRCECRHELCREFAVHVPTDTAAMLASPALPANAFDAGDTMMSESELRELGKLVGTIPGAPWQPTAPKLSWGLGHPGLVRYNRVEGLSVGARADTDFGPVQADATARIGVADRWPNAELGAERPGTHRSVRLDGYRRLATFDDSDALGFGNSASALLFGTDDGDYLRATGAELIVTPSGTRLGTDYTLRLYGEKQRAAQRSTNVSLARAFDRNSEFRVNPQADRANQLGFDLVLRRADGLNALRPRLESELRLRAENGSYDFARAALTTRVTAPVLHVLMSIEAAAGSSAGTVPLQSLWRLGGSETLRGYDPGRFQGEAFWRGRIEIANQLPAARIALFSDAGWAGARSSFTSSRPAYSAGIGLSTLDGLVRFDLARTLDAAKQWRAYLYFDAAL